MIIIMTIIMITNTYTNKIIRGDYEKKVLYQMKIFKIMIGLQILFMTRVDEDNKVQRKATLGGSN